MSLTSHIHSHQQIIQHVAFSWSGRYGRKDLQDRWPGAGELFCAYWHERRDYTAVMANRPHANTREQPSSFPMEVRGVHGRCSQKPISERSDDGSPRPYGASCGNSCWFDPFYHTGKTNVVAKIRILATEQRVSFPHIRRCKRRGTFGITSSNATGLIIISRALYILNYDRMPADCSSSLCSAQTTYRSGQ